MRTYRLTGILVLAAISLLFWVRERRAVRDHWKRLERSRGELAGLESQIAAEQGIREALCHELDVLGSSARATRAAIARAEANRTASDPESRWASPPLALPEWNPASPYLWIEKDILTTIPMQPFTAPGTLHPMVTDSLAIEPDSARTLAAILDRHIGNVRTMEAAQAVVNLETDSTVPDGTDRPVTLSVTLPYADSSPIRTALESDLRRELGDSRADLLLHWGRPWLEDQFGSPDQNRTYRVTRDADGTFSIVTKTPTGSYSTSGISDFKIYIPEHLRSWFEPLQSQGP